METSRGEAAQATFCGSMGRLTIFFLKIASRRELTSRRGEPLPALRAGYTPLEVLAKGV
jgi:hypothetical protein